MSKTTRTEILYAAGQKAIAVLGRVREALSAPTETGAMGALDGIDGDLAGLKALVDALVALRR